MTKWIIPAPVWVGNHLQQSGNVLAALHGPYADPTPWYVAYDNAKHWFHTEAEARSWVEGKVMEAMGATPLDMPELASPAVVTTVMAAEIIADRAWNQAVLAAASLFIDVGDRMRILALKRGDGNE